MSVCFLPASVFIYLFLCLFFSIDFYPFISFLQNLCQSFLFYPNISLPISMSFVCLAIPPCLSLPMCVASILDPLGLILLLPPLSFYLCPSLPPPSRYHLYFLFQYLQVSDIRKSRFLSFKRN